VDVPVDMYGREAVQKKRVSTLSQALFPHVELNPGTRKSKRKTDRTCSVFQKLTDDESL
jgi:hypothetical protein